MSVFIFNKKLHQNINIELFLDPFRGILSSFSLGKLHIYIMFLQDQNENKIEDFPV